MVVVVVMVVVAAVATVVVVIVAVAELYNCDHSANSYVTMTRMKIVMMPYHQ